MRLVFLDTETTGLSPAEHKITEIGCLEVINREITGVKYQTYLNPEREIDEGAARITGLTYGFLQDKPTFAEIVDDFAEFLLRDKDTQLVIHNAPFDIGFLNKELNVIKHNLYRINDRFDIFDTLKFARKRHPGKKNNLDALCERYGIENNNREYHGALLDADLLAKLYLSMTKGQISFNLINTNKNINSIHGKSNDFLNNNLNQQKAHDLPIIFANEQENKLHQEYIDSIQRN